MHKCHFCATEINFAKMYKLYQSKSMSNRQKFLRKNKSFTQMTMMTRKNNTGRGKQSGKIPQSAIEEPAVTIQTLSTNLIKQQPDIQDRLRKTNQIIIEQSKRCSITTIECKTPSRRLFRKLTSTGCSIPTLCNQLRTDCSQGRNPDQALLRRNRERKIPSKPNPAALAPGIASVSSWDCSQAP